jgi:hypothetical protein
MTAIPHNWPAGSRRTANPLKTALVDVYRGFMDISHNSMALLGTALAVGLIVLSARADLRTSAEQQLLGWLLQRHDVVADVTPFTAEPSTTEMVATTEAVSLPKQQANVAEWLSRKYRVAPEPLSVLVAEAFAIGQKAQLDPTLILAVMAIESRFNPYAESPVGAQGLMQVLTRVHTDKFEHFGGEAAAFDPVANLRVGVKVLQDCVKRNGSVEGGLRCYVGAVSTDGSWYINKVMSEHLRIQSVAKGLPMPTSFPQFQATPAEVPAAPAESAAEQGVELEAEAPAAPVEPPQSPLVNS